MRLHLTATSERGKPITKSGNELIDIRILNEDRVTIAFITFYPDNFAIISTADDIKVDMRGLITQDKPKTRFQSRAQAVADGKCPDCGNTLDEVGNCRYCEPKTAREDYKSKDCEKCGRFISDLGYANNGGRCNDCR